MKDWESCKNYTHIDHWRVVKIKPLNTRIVHMHMLKQEDESQFGDDGDALTNMLYIGDNFVVLAEDGNEEGVQYYLLQCQ
jgi:hypothetical protein